MLFVLDISILSFLITFRFPHSLVSYCYSFVLVSLYILNLYIWHFLSSFLVPVVSHNELLMGPQKAKLLKAVLWDCIHWLMWVPRILVIDGSTVTLLDWKRLRKKCKWWVLFVHQAENETPTFSVHYVLKHGNFVHNLLWWEWQFLVYEGFQDFALSCTKSKNSILKHSQYYWTEAVVGFLWGGKLQ